MVFVSASRDSDNKNAHKGALVGKESTNWRTFVSDPWGSRRSREVARILKHLYKQPKSNTDSRGKRSHKDPGQAEKPAQLWKTQLIEEGATVVSVAPSSPVPRIERQVERPYALYKARTGLP